MAGCEKDLTWFDPNGEEMTSAGWSDAERRTIGMRLFGLELDEPDVRGVPFAEEVLFAVFHASDTPSTFVLPACSPDAHWALLLDTAASAALANGLYPSMSAYPLQGRSVVLLRQERQVASASTRGERASRGRGRPRRRSSDYRAQ